MDREQSGNMFVLRRSTASVIAKKEEKKLQKKKVLQHIKTAEIKEWEEEIKRENELDQKIIND